jgi:hypothetical protein
MYVRKVQTKIKHMVIYVRDFKFKLKNIYGCKGNILF